MVTSPDKSPHHLEESEFHLLTPCLYGHTHGAFLLQAKYDNCKYYPYTPHLEYTYCSLQVEQFWHSLKIEKEYHCEILALLGRKFRLLGRRTYWKTFLGVTSSGVENIRKFENMTFTLDLSSMSLLKKTWPPPLNNNNKTTADFENKWSKKCKWERPPSTLLSSTNLVWLFFIYLWQLHRITRDEYIGLPSMAY